MNQKQFIFIALASIVLIGGVLWYAKTQKDVVESVTTQAEPTDSQEATSISPDASNWKTYRNEKLGFEFKYPGGWELEEKVISAAGWTTVHPDWVFRYVNLRSEDFSIEIGVKNIDEKERIKLQSWKTGIPAGDFQRGETVDIANGRATVWKIVYTEGSQNSIRLIWYCGTDSKATECKSFSLGDGKVASIGVYSLHERDSDPWLQVENEMKGLVESFQTI